MTRNHTHFNLLTIEGAEANVNNRGNVRNMWQWGAFAKPLLPWKSNKYYIFLSVSARVRLRACVWVREGDGVGVCLLIQHAKRMAVLSPAVPLVPPNFSTLSPQLYDFRKIVTEHKICVLIFSTTFISNISHSNKNSATYRHKREKSSYKVYVMLFGY
jgi:hypothetical protein